MGQDEGDEFAEFETTHEEFGRMMAEGEPAELVAVPVRLSPSEVEISANRIAQPSGIDVSRARIPA